MASPETLGIGPASAAVTASVDFTDSRPNMSRTSNKFVPMQLRTQPLNLPSSQLQRVNTNFGDSKGTIYKYAYLLPGGTSLERGKGVK